MIESRIGFYKDDSAVLIAEPAMREPSERITWTLKAESFHQIELATAESGRWIVVCSHDGEIRVQAYVEFQYEYAHTVSPGYPLQLYLAHGDVGFLIFTGVTPTARVEYIVSESPFPAET